VQEIAAGEHAKEGSVLAREESSRVRLIGTLEARGPLSRADLARETGLSRATVSNLISEMIADGVVHESGDGARGRSLGRPGVPVALSRGEGFYVGVDFGRLNLRVAIADLSYRIVDESIGAFDVDVPAQVALDSAAAAVDALIARSGVDRALVRAVGVGVPGPVDERTGMLHAGSILASWVGADVPGGLRRRLSLPIHIDNDANLGALAESTFGGAVGARTALYVLLSVGVGLGIVIEGQVFRGAIGIAGELGHVVVDEKGDICRCGSRGCLEAIISVNTLRQALRTALGPITVDDMLEHAATGHVGARRVIADAGTMVGRLVGDLCNYFNPDLVLVGGELARAGAILLEPFEKSMRRYAIARAVEHVQVAGGGLGDGAEVLGAILFAAQKDRALGARADAAALAQDAI
jgi:predicted NBD/HSP70 family sugar kinase/biotin operon repressor